MSLADAQCEGTYEQPCIEYADDRVNIRLHQWCAPCLYKLSARLNHQPYVVNEPKAIQIEGFPELMRRWRAPLALEDLTGKYYGTVVADADGNEVVNFWTARGEPSEREKRKFRDWTPERWRDYCSDSHWECAITLPTVQLDKSA